MFDLALELQEREGCLVGWFEYDSELFEVETIARIVGHFQTLLEGAVKDPDRRVSELALLTESERHRLLIDFNATVRPVPETTLPVLFEAQAARTPEAIAVICGTKSLSYAELNERANRLAHYLRSLGVGPEVLVGTYFERSTEMVVGLLGVLKAGRLRPARPRHSPTTAGIHAPRRPGEGPSDTTTIAVPPSRPRRPGRRPRK